VGKVPVLKPEEVIKLLVEFGSGEVRQRVLTDSLDMKKDVAQLFQCIKGEIFLLCF
jgi:hypothetical protein